MKMKKSLYTLLFVTGLLSFFACPVLDPLDLFQKYPDPKKGNLKTGQNSGDRLSCCTNPATFDECKAECEKDKTKAYDGTKRLKDRCSVANKEQQDICTTGDHGKDRPGLWDPEKGECDRGGQEVV